MQELRSQRTLRRPDIEIIHKMKESSILELRQGLIPLYEELLEKTNVFSGIQYPFAVQWGKHYEPDSGKGILFVGRATNEWCSKSNNVDVLFGNPPSKDAIFNLKDQMTWVYDSVRQHWDNYNTNRSAFWRIICGVASAFYPHGDELSYVAWSNVCKIQRAGGKNPTGKMFALQIKTCEKILDKELEVLRPRIVVLFIGEYGKREILTYLNGGTMPVRVEKKAWVRYFARAYSIRDVVYICTEHPQGKPEKEHIDCLVSLINQYI